MIYQKCQNQNGGFKSPGILKRVTIVSKETLFCCTGLGRRITPLSLKMVLSTDILKENNIYHH